MLLCIFGIICILYYGAIVFYAGFRSTFAPFWLASGLALTGLGCLWDRLMSFEAGRAGAIALGIVAVLFFVAFLTIEIRIIGEAWRKADDGADYVIILGAQVQGTRPSRSLARRVKAGALYLKRNPQAMAVVAGGQGPGEQITEAACMAQMLEKMGICRHRIILEDRSTDTYENIRNSMEFFDCHKKVVIVTCGYHMYRALALARTAGIRRVQGFPCRSGQLLLVNYYVREFFAVLHYRICRRI